MSRRTLPEIIPATDEEVGTYKGAPAFYYFWINGRRCVHYGGFTYKTRNKSSWGFTKFSAGVEDRLPGHINDVVKSMIRLLQ